MFRIEEGKNKSLQVLANEFYEKLNPRKKKSKAFYKHSLNKRILKQIRHEPDSKKKHFYLMLAKNKFELLKKIITGTPGQLQAIFDNIKALVVAKTIPPFSAPNKKGVDVSTAFGNEVLTLFDYKACRGSAKFIWLFDELDVVVCPYCNYSNMHKVIIKEDNDKDKEKILNEFDHFIPKVIAPYFSISFFNLIPSCHICNSTLKGATIFSLKEYTHPYVDDLHSCVTFSIDKPIIMNDKKSFDVAIITQTTDDDEIRKSGNSTALFAIQQRYNNFKQDILRLERKRHQYTEKVKEELLNDGIYGKVFKDRAEVNAHIADELDIPLNAKQAMRQEKGKFKLDIAKEFGILDRNNMAAPRGQP